MIGKLLKTCNCKCKCNNKVLNIKYSLLDFFNDYKLNKFKICSDTEIYDLILYINKNKNFNLNKLLSKYSHIIFTIIKNTENIIPFKSINDFYLTKRLYHIFYNINNIPKCNKCLKPLIFKNFNIRIYTMYM